MLISFSLENWRSFRDRTEFSAVASRERQHNERLARVEKYQLRLLPTAAIYGGNASGKTNFFQALRFARALVVEGTRDDARIPVEPFQLDPACRRKPTRFWFELLVEETIYAFSFAVTADAVLEERLVKITSSSETELYRREGDQFRLGEPWAQDDLLQFAHRGTRDNQLYLTNAVSQKVDTFRPVYDWFRHTLVLIAPDSRFGPFEQFIDQDSKLRLVMNRLLGELDTGISRLDGEKVPLDSLPIPEELRTALLADVRPGHTIRLLDERQNLKFIVRRRADDELEAQKLVTYHTGSDGKDVRMEMPQESDGTQRVIDLLPAFLSLTTVAANKVYVVDEIGRSLHSLLVRRLLETYLSSCDENRRAQLLFTTHDILLMDQDLLRRDEMWVTERTPDGASTLFSFSEYPDVRKDKNLRKSYLQGRLGGVPRLLPLSSGMRADKKPAGVH